MARKSKHVESWSVIVGNIGTVHNGYYEKTAVDHFNYYVEDSRRGFGRAGNERVVLFRDGEIVIEYNPTTGQLT